MVAKSADKKQQKKQHKKTKQKQPPAKFSKRGVSLTASVLLILKVIYDNLVALRLSKKRPKSVQEHFRLLTGVAYSSLFRAVKKADAEGGTMQEPKPKGRARVTIEDKFEDFYSWVADKIERAKKGGYITIKTIREDLRKEKDLNFSKRAIRRTLRKMGFVYHKRKGVWISRRNEPGVQAKLKAFLEWVVSKSHTEIGAGGKTVYYWDIPCGFYDETYLWTKAYRDRSWCAPIPGTKRHDLVCDKGKKGIGDQRASVLYAIFSASSQPPIRDVMVHWQNSWTGKKHEFSGSCTSDHVLRYLETRVFCHIGEGGSLILDNCSTHKEFIQKLDEYTQDELWEFIVSKEDSKGGRGQGHKYDIWQCSSFLGGWGGIGQPCRRRDVSPIFRRFFFEKIV